jgi:hypothetical protein
MYIHSTYPAYLWRSTDGIPWTLVRRQGHDWSFETSKARMTDGLCEAAVANRP